MPVAPPDDIRTNLIPVMSKTKQDIIFELQENQRRYVNCILDKCKQVGMTPAGQPEQAGCGD